VISLIKLWLILLNPIKWGRVGRYGREGSEGQVNKEDEKEGKSGTWKGPLARECSSLSLYAITPVANFVSTHADRQGVDILFTV